MVAPPIRSALRARPSDPSNHTPDANIAGLPTIHTPPHAINAAWPDLHSRRAKQPNKNIKNPKNIISSANIIAPDARLVNRFFHSWSHVTSVTAAKFQTIELAPRETDLAAHT